MKNKTKHENNIKKLKHEKIDIFRINLSHTKITDLSKRISAKSNLLKLKIVWKV